MSLQRPALDRRPGLALYAAVEEALEALIKERGLAPGDALPAEQELQSLFRVSRATVRQALGQLERRHIVERHQGRGTFLAIPTMELSLPQLTGFSEQVRARGMRPTSRLVDYRAVNWAQDRDARFFPAGTPLIRMTRVRCANEVPIGIHIAYLPQDIVERAGFSERSLHANASLSLYRQLEDAGVRIQWAEEYLRARAADRAEAKLLGVRAGAHVMDVLRLTRYEGDRLMEVVRSVLLGDRYTYIAYLERHPAAAGLGGLVTHAREEEVARR
jgi:GntR family transcriptional regulator